jgi:hypothetical protein
VSPGRLPPLGLLAGLAVGFVLYRVIDLAFAGWLGDGRPDYQRWRAVSIGASFAVLGLFVAGAIELRRRTAGRARIGANLVVCGTLAMLAIAVLRQYASFEHDTDRDLHLWLGRLSITGRHMTVAGVIVAGWDHRPVRLLAAPLAVVSLLATPYDFYRDYVYGWLSGTGPVTWFVVDSVAEAAYVGLMAAAVWLGAPGPGPAGYDGTARALDRTASALYARLWIAVGSAFLVTSMFAGGGGEGLGKLFVVGVPLANALAGIVLVVGVFGAAQLAVARGIQLRFLAAGAALTWVIAIQSVQVYLRVRSVFGDDDGGVSSYDTELVPALPIAVPVVLAVGFLVVVDAVRAVGGLLAFDDLRTHAAAAAVTVVVTQVVIIGAGYWMATSRHMTEGMAIFALLVIIAAGIGTLVAVAKVCREAASGLRARTDLPTATVVNREP